MCFENFVLDEKLEGRINLYYSLGDFFANHRDYVRSRSYAQLRGEESSSDYSECEGSRLVKEVFDFQEDKYSSAWGEKLEANQVASPCGLQAKALFTGNI